MKKNAKFQSKRWLMLYFWLCSATVIAQNISGKVIDENGQALLVAYNYASKYLIKATVRRDGFSGFSKNNKTGIFPSLGIGWVISEENFFKNIPVINYLKVRGSYGENGNKVGRYSSLARVASTDDSKYVFGDGGLTAVGRSVSSLANADLKLERTRGINIGAYFSVLNSRIDENVEYFITLILTTYCGKKYYLKHRGFRVYLLI